MQSDMSTARGGADRSGGGAAAPGGSAGAAIGAGSDRGVGIGGTGTSATSDVTDPVAASGAGGTNVCGGNATDDSAGAGGIGETDDSVDATTQLAELRAQLAAAQTELSSAREALTASERRREVERALLEADTLDLEAAAMLAEAAVGAMNEPDVGAAVRTAVGELQRTRPHLFRQQRSLGGAMSEHVDPPGAMEQAARAAGCGDKRALLSYLRLRRAAG